MTPTLDEALSSFPVDLQSDIRSVALDYLDLVRPLLDRGMAPPVAVMAGMALDLDGRARFDEALQSVRSGR